jgi:hypothetical protein
MNLNLPIIACLFLGLTFGCSTTTNDHATNPESNWEKRIISKHKYPYAYLINPHLGEVNVLIVDGHRFENVRGEKPFYLRVPETNAILFVVDEKNNTITVHYYNLDKKEDIGIHTAGILMFGNNIGYDSESRKDTIELTKNGDIALCTTLFESERTVKIFVYLNLSNMTMVTKKTFVYDKSGKLLHEYNEPFPF